MRFVKRLGTGQGVKIELYSETSVETSVETNPETPVETNPETSSEMNCVVVKRITYDTEPEYRQKIKDNFQRVYDLTNILVHNNILQLWNYDTNIDALVYEPFSGIDMFDYLEIYKFRNAPLLMKVYDQILKGVEYLHDLHIAHLDLKLENVIVNVDSGVAKIIDFDHAREFKVDNQYVFLNLKYGTPSYSPPELYNRFINYRGDALDVWCCGLILYIFLFDNLPWKIANLYRDSAYISCYRYSQRGLLQPKIFDNTHYVNDDYDVDQHIYNEIFYKIFQHEPERRIDISELRSIFSYCSLIRN